MTLVAGFQYDDVPILLGDFLISAGADQSVLRKKVHLISSNLVVGWANDLWAARPFLKDLFTRFKDQQVQRPVLENFLRNYPTRDLGALSVQIVGWLIDDEPRCFFWRSDYPLEIYHAPQHFVGSGAETFKEILSRRSFVGSNRQRHGVEAAIYHSLFTSCRLISDEILVGLNQKQGFGFAFETVYFDGCQFRFVDDILYLAADIQFTIGQADKNVAVGLGSDTSGAFTDLSYALWCRADGFVHAYESGVPVGKPMKYATDDVFSIDLITTNDLQMVMYTQNRQPINLTQCRAKFPLLVRTLVKEGRCLIKEAKIRTMTTTENHPDI